MEGIETIDEDIERVSKDCTDITRRQTAHFLRLMEYMRTINDEVEDDFRQTRFVMRSGFHEVLEELREVCDQIKQEMAANDTAIKYFIGQVERLAGHPNI